MPTSPATASVSGASFTVNVAVCDLDPTLTIRDFLVLENGVLTANPLSYTKVTPTSIQYSGPSLPSTTLEVRRSTPRTVISTQVPNTKIRAIDWNREFDRRVRIDEEFDVFGAGGGFSVRLPLNGVYDSSWSTDTLFSPTRQALFNKIETLAPLASPALTGNPTVPTQLTSDNSTRVASTAYVKSNLITLAPLASPAFTGVPTVPTPLTSDNSTTVASTSYVKSNLTSYATLASPALTGTPTAPTVAEGSTSTQVVNAQALSRSHRPFVRLNRSSALSLTAVSTVDLPFNNEVSDNSNVYSAPNFVPPYTGIYLLTCLIDVLSTDVVAVTLTDSANTEVARVAQTRLTATGFITANGACLAALTSGVTYKFRIYSNHTTSTGTGSQCQASITFMGADA